MLYQKGTQRIEVIVRKQADGSDLAKTHDSDNVSSETEKGGAGVGAKSGSRRATRKIITNTTHVISTLKAGFDRIVTYRVQGMGNEHGDQALQDSVERNIEKVEDIANIASNIGRGAVFGAWAGPAGIAVGIATGVASSAMSMWNKYAVRDRDFQVKVFKENNAIEYRRARASISLTNGRLR